MKNIIFIVLLISVTFAELDNATEGYYLSPHGLGKTPEVTCALEATLSKFVVART
jgi:hypothetical protein